MATFVPAELQEPHLSLCGAGAAHGPAAPDNFRLQEPPHLSSAELGANHEPAEPDSFRLREPHLSACGAGGSSRACSSREACRS